MAVGVTMRGKHDMGALLYWDEGPSMGAFEDVSTFIVNVELIVSPAYTAGLAVTPAYAAELGVVNVST